MIIHFMRQLDQATGCPDIWRAVTLGVSAKVFLGEMTPRIGSLSEAGLPPQVGGPPPIGCPSHRERRVFPALEWKLRWLLPGLRPASLQTDTPPPASLGPPFASSPCGPWGLPAPQS